MSRVVALKPFPRWRGEVSRLFRAAYTEEATLLGVVDFPPLTRVLSETESNEFFGLVNNDQLVAVLELEASDDASLIASLAVLPDCFRRGFASALLASLLTVRPGPFTVRTAAGNAPALALYNRHGFVETGRVDTPEGLELIELRRDQVGSA